MKKSNFHYESGLTPNHEATPEHYEVSKKARFDHNKSGLPVRGKKWQKLTAGIAAWHEAEDGKDINPKPHEWSAL